MTTTTTTPALTEEDLRRSPLGVAVLNDDGDELRDRTDRDCPWWCGATHTESDDHVGEEAVIPSLPDPDGRVYTTTVLLTQGPGEEPSLLINGIRHDRDSGLLLLAAIVDQVAALGAIR